MHGSGTTGNHLRYRIGPSWFGCQPRYLRKAGLDRSRLPGRGRRRLGRLHVFEYLTGWHDIRRLWACDGPTGESSGVSGHRDRPAPTRCGRCGMDERISRSRPRMRQQSIHLAPAPATTNRQVSAYQPRGRSSGARHSRQASVRLCVGRRSGRRWRRHALARPHAGRSDSLHSPRPHYRLDPDTGTASATRLPVSAPALQQTGDIDGLGQAVVLAIGIDGRLRCLTRGPQLRWTPVNGTCIPSSVSRMWTAMAGWKSSALPGRRS